MLVVVQLAVGHPLELVEGATPETFVAIMTIEMLNVPLCAQCVDAIATDRLVARTTARCKDLVEALLAVRSVVAFEEVAPLEWRKTLCADEAIHVPLTTQRRQTAISDRIVAVCTLRTKVCLIAPLTMWLPLLFIKRACAQWITTRGAVEVVGMIGAPHCLNHSP